MDRRHRQLGGFRAALDQLRRPVVFDPGEVGKVRIDPHVGRDRLEVSQFVLKNLHRVHDDIEQVGKVPAVFEVGQRVG